mmetsp:Transcript_67012/g.173523  ORF Transcript_67012/g.173523 Transcript_67012/m.173523 type:complete len:297 (-) Transcript_67012:207-1097(-)
MSERRRALAPTCRVCARTHPQTCEPLAAQQDQSRTTTALGLRLAAPRIRVRGRVAVLALEGLVARHLPRVTELHPLARTAAAEGRVVAVLLRLWLLRLLQEAVLHRKLEGVADDGHDDHRGDELQPLVVAEAGRLEGLSNSRVQHVLRQVDADGYQRLHRRHDQQPEARLAQPHHPPRHPLGGSNLLALLQLRFLRLACTSLCVLVVADVDAADPPDVGPREVSEQPTQEGHEEDVAKEADEVPDALVVVRGVLHNGPEEHRQKHIHEVPPTGAHELLGHVPDPREEGAPIRLAPP